MNLEINSKFIMVIFSPPLCRRIVRFIDFKIVNSTIKVKLGHLSQDECRNLKGKFSNQMLEENVVLDDNIVSE